MKRRPWCLIRTKMRPTCKDTAAESGLSLSGLMMQNELALHTKEELEQHFAAVWEVMSGGIERGISTEGVLPGKLRVPRRAAALRRMLVSQDNTNSDPMAVVDWINMFALAVNEENAAGRPRGHRGQPTGLRDRACGTGLLR
ncbi:L-serine dehydratase 2 [Raoultella terrigena]|uniref:L-serine ammonia-lyase n=1 Tax=Raoultella terrigena TaxID=577 RepID=A0A3P8LYT2_RAOTE|nr:L-serine dehydratase 2 [Raoultella terrigena]